LPASGGGKIKSAQKDGILPHLVVLPPSLLFNWESEIKRFCPDLKIFFYTGKERTASFDGFDVVLTTYGLVRRDIEKLKEIMFDVVIFDEAQAVKNLLADTTGAVRLLKAGFKLTMTGTPLENHVGEYYSIIDLAVPGLLGEYEKFKPLIKLEVSPALDLIIRRTRPFVLRRTKEMILKELPPKVETDIYLDLTDKQKALYKRTVDEVKSVVDRAYKTKTRAQAGIIALTAILKLRQICIAPRLVASSMRESSPKAEFLIEKLKELIDEGHGALVFSQFTKFLDILEEDLRRHGIDFLRLDGSTQVKRRKKIVGDFQSCNGSPVFLLSLKAGGQRLNLTRASYVFHLDPWWNPAVENQASDRAHRIGQKRHVTVTRLLMRHTIEEKMMALKSRKLQIYKAVMEGSVTGRKGVSITREDFDYLLR
jgi:SNF2 family DNA or RNA helicase